MFRLSWPPCLAALTLPTPPLKWGKHRRRRLPVLLIWKYLILYAALPKRFRLKFYFRKAWTFGLGWCRLCSATSSHHWTGEGCLQVSSNWLGYWRDLLMYCLHKIILDYVWFCVSVHLAQGHWWLWPRADGCPKSGRICHPMLCRNQGRDTSSKHISMLSSKVSVEVQKGQEFFEREYPCLAAVNRAASTVTN